LGHPSAFNRRLKDRCRNPIIVVMSVESVMARVAELHSALAPRTPVVAQQVAAPTAQNATQFATMLNAAGVAPTANLAAAGSPGAKMVALAQAEVGVAEQPPGSNDSPRIAQFRQATAGSGVGPWCAYFVSWAAREAGVPLGDQGQGFGRVDDVWAWAQRAGKAQPAAAGPPQPGDLIVWDEHIGIVESVLPDGRVQTVEGNSSDQVSRRVHDATGGGAVGYVRLG
jgi:hypothetical protein